MMPWLSSRSSLALWLSAAVGMLALPRPTWACVGCPTAYFFGPSGIADGDTVPANHVFYLRGLGLDPARIQVHVDDAPASLRAVPQLRPQVGWCHEDWAVTVEPQPPPGARVVLAGSPCPDDAPCDPIALTFFAGPPDTDPPRIAQAAVIDVFDHGLTADCSSVASAVTFYAVLAVVEDSDRVDPDFVFVQTHQGDALGRSIGEPIAAFALPHPVDGRLAYSLTIDLLDAAHACLRITALDAAGNAAADVLSCGTCRLRSDPTFGPIELPPEPHWTDDDEVPGGPCDDDEPEPGDDEVPGAPDPGTSATTTGDPFEPGDRAPDSEGAPADGDDELADRACGCRFTGPGPAGFLGVGLLGLGRRRRGS